MDDGGLWKCHPTCGQQDMHTLPWCDYFVVYVGGVSARVGCRKLPEVPRCLPSSFKPIHQSSRRRSTEHGGYLKRSVRFGKLEGGERATSQVLHTDRDVGLHGTPTPENGPGRGFSSAKPAFRCLPIGS